MSSKIKNKNVVITNINNAFPCATITYLAVMAPKKSPVPSLFNLIVSPFEKEPALVCQVPIKYDCPSTLEFLLSSSQPLNITIKQINEKIIIIIFIKFFPPFKQGIKTSNCVYNNA